MKILVLAYIPMLIFEEFKESIAAMNLAGVEKEKVVIKSYKQISKEAFNCLGTTTC